jgi:hypothetical protein
VLDNVSLLWYHLDDSTITATRGEVRRWAGELGMPGGILRRSSTAGAFITACTNSRHEYRTDEGEDAGEHVISGRVSTGKRSSEHVTVSIYLDEQIKVGEIKWFAPRRTEAGLVEGSHRTRSIIRPSAPPAHRQAASAWIQATTVIFEEAGALVPWPIIRRVMRVALEERAVPVLNRRALFFFYDEDLDRKDGIAPVGEFLRRVAPGPEWTTMRLDAGNDGTVLAASADAHLLALVHTLIESMESWVINTNQGRRSRKTALAQWGERYEQLYEQAARHESRLAAELTQTREALLLTKDMMSALDPTAGLPSVTSR